MSRRPSVAARRGSQRWVQQAVNQRPSAFAALFDAITSPIEWLSPLEADDYAEYRDQAVLDLLEVVPRQTTLHDFWPVGGPQWDALGRTSDGAVVLVEAKAHVPELVSGPSKAGARSLPQIERALALTQGWLSAAPRVPWNGPFYEYGKTFLPGPACGGFEKT